MQSKHKLTVLGLSALISLQNRKRYFQILQLNSFTVIYS